MNLISIKNSFANCSTCSLLDAPSCVFETNCEDDISKVDVVFIAEAPGKDEIKKGRPLIGKAGKKFRKYFEKYDIHKMNYLLTNIVLCQTPIIDDMASTPEDDVIAKCRANCMNIVRACNPKLVVLLGSSPMRAFGIAEAGITSIHEKYETVKWKDYDTMVLVHPSFVIMNGGSWEEKFENGIAKVAEKLTGKEIETDHKSNIKTLDKGIRYYDIPEKYYTDEYRLVDVQFLNRTSQVLYIFRDKKNNKEFYKTNDDYYCYQAKDDIETRKIVPYDQLNQVTIKYKDRYNLDPNITYEGDVRITAKHAMDYYHYSKGECPKVFMNIMFFDIEIDTGDKRVFPKPEEAAFPINMITSIFNKNKTVFVVDNGTEPIKKLEGAEMKIFKSEKKMLSAFISFFKQQDPDFISGWNAINFDLSYIFNRLPQIGLVQSSISKFNEFYVG